MAPGSASPVHASGRRAFAFNRRNVLGVMGAGGERADVDTRCRAWVTAPSLGVAVAGTACPIGGSRVVLRRVGAPLFVLRSCHPTLSCTHDKDRRSPHPERGHDGTEGRDLWPCPEETLLLATGRRRGQGLGSPAGVWGSQCHAIKPHPARRPGVKGAENLGRAEQKFKKNRNPS